MTNTPMTSREAFEQWHKSQYQGYNSYSYKHDTTAYIDDHVEIAFVAWQASQAQQASVIARLKRVIQGYEGEVSVNEKTIAELLEALEEIASRTQDDNLTWWQIKAREAIAKVKGK